MEDGTHLVRVHYGDQVAVSTGTHLGTCRLGVVPLDDLLAEERLVAVIVVVGPVGRTAGE